MRIRRRILPTIAAGLLAAFAGTTTVQAQSNGEHALEGAWTHEVVPGPGAPPFAGVINTFVIYMNGITIEYNGPADPGGGTLGASVGSYRFSAQTTFEVTWLKPITDSTGRRTFTVKIRSRIQMNSRDEYTGDDITSLMDPDGVVLISWPTRTHGKRIRVEPVN